MRPWHLLVTAIATTASWVALAADNDAFPHLMEERGYRQVPFQIDDRGYLLLPVRADAFVMRFLLDTGAGMSALSSQVARDLRLTVTETRGTTVGAGGATRSRVVTLDSLTIGHLRMRKKRLTVCELNDPLPPGTAFDPEAIEGLMGADFFMPLQSIIDYRRQTLFFREPDAPAARPPGDVLQELGYRGVDLTTNVYGHLIVPVMCQGTNLSMILDSGVPHTILDISVARELALATETTHTRGTGIGGPLGKVWRTRLEQFVLGAAVLRGYPVFVTDLNQGERETDPDRLCIRGVLGNDILRFFSSVISYPDRRLYLKPPRETGGTSR